MARVAICPDVEGPHGGDRLVRCLALAEELSARGVSPTFICDTAPLPWARLQIEARGLDLVPPPSAADGYASLLDRLEVDAVVLHPPPSGTDVDTAVPATGRPTLAIVDGAARSAGAHVVVDPNIEARHERRTAADGPTVLAGVEYALVRNDVLANRPISPPQRRSVEVPRVTALFDEADWAAVGPRVAQTLAATGRSVEATFVTPDEQAGRDIAAVRSAPHQRIEVAAPSWRLHERLARSDVVIGAARHSTYEWLCMGASLCLVWTAEEQVERYRQLMVRRVVVGLGSAEELRADAAAGTERMARLLSDARERTRLGEAGWRLVDGLGRARVADALLALL